MKALVLKSLFVISAVAVTALAWAAPAVEPCGANDTEWVGTQCGLGDPGQNAGLNKAPQNAEGGVGPIVCRDCLIASMQNQASLFANTNPTPRSAIPSNVKPTNKEGRK